MARRLSSAHLANYLDGGIYHDFFEYVKADTELAFEIRVKDEIMVCCQKDLILTVSHREKTSDKITMLNPRYYTNRKDNLKLSELLREPSDLKDMHKVRQYFEDTKALCKNYKSHDEFIVQQQYKSAHDSFDEDFLAIDMEWTPDQSAIPPEYRVDKTKIDLLIVANTPNEEGFHDVYLAEVKCGLGAVNGKSGIEDHMRMSQNCIGNVYVRQNLLQDITSIIRQKTQLGLFEGTPVSYHFSERPKVMFILACSSDYERQRFESIIQKTKESGNDIKVDYVISSMQPQVNKTRNVGISINSFTEKCRQLQGIYREEIHEPMGVGPGKTSTIKRVNMIVDGEHTGKNFVNLFSFEYAKRRVATKNQKETFDEYRLFNNLLSSQPMAFNLFCPMIEMLQNGKTELVTKMICKVFPNFDISRVTDVELEYLHTDIENYLNDRTAMDAIIRYENLAGKPCFIAIETKYTDVLGENSARDTSRQMALIKELGFFKPESEQALLCGDKSISQIYRNFLLAECYRIKESAQECYSIVLSPKEHPTTETEVKSLQDELRPEYQYKIQAVSLEDFVEDILKVCTTNQAVPFVWFKNRYLNFSKLK